MHAAPHERAGRNREGARVRQGIAVLKRTSRRFAKPLVHHALELGMYDVLDMHIHKERPSSNTRRAKRDIDNCFWYGQREKAASGVGHPRRDVVLSKFEISRSGQFTCPVGCGALFVSRGPPDVDQATREKYANHIFYESEGARRWRRYLESQPQVRWQAGTRRVASPRRGMARG